MPARSPCLVGWCRAGEGSRRRQWARIDAAGATQRADNVPPDNNASLVGCLHSPVVGLLEVRHNVAAGRRQRLLLSAVAGGASNVIPRRCTRFRRPAGCLSICHAVFRCRLLLLSAILGACRHPLEATARDTRLTVQGEAWQNAVEAGISKEPSEEPGSKCTPAPAVLSCRVRRLTAINF